MSGLGVPGRIERRRAPRFNIALPVTFTIAADGRECAATVDNLSFGGVLLLSEAAIDNGTDIVIHLPVGADAVMNLDACVVRTSHVGEFGVAFLTLDDEQMQRLADLVDARKADL